MFLCIVSVKALSIDPALTSSLVYTEERANHHTIQIFRQEPPKPVSDSFFKTEGDDVFLFSGVVANSIKLINDYAVIDSEQLIKKAMQTDLSAMVSRFHGQFGGLHYHKASSVLRIFTNQTNSLRIYYYYADGLLIAGTSLKLINDLLRSNGINTTIDETGARMILTYGYLLSDFTSIKGIRQLKAGHYLEYKDGKLAIKSYHKLTNEIKHNNLNESLNEIQRLFSDAVKYAFEKDREFKKPHIAFLSGGLDSRQTVMTAYNLGYKDITCLNFAQPRCLDETVAAKITHDLGLKLHNFSLADGNYLLDIDSNLKYNDGQILLHGSAHLNAAIASLNLADYGILHSGMIGDAVLGSFFKKHPYHTKPDVSDGCYSKKLFDTIYQDVAFLENEYPNNEMFLFYNRCFNAAINGDYACAQYTHSVSPFLEPELLQYCLNINPALKFKQLCYKEWMKKFNPRGAGYTWDKTGTNLYAPEWYVWLRKKYLLNTIILFKKLSGKPEKYGMNPFDWWWYSNPALSVFFNQSVEANHTFSKLVSPELLADTNTLYQTGNVTDKMLAYTLMAGTTYLYS